MKKIVLSLLIASHMFGMQKQYELSNVLAFSKQCAKSRESLGDLQLLKHQDNFYVVKNGFAKLVKSYDVDPLLKRANKKQLKKYLEQDGYIMIDQLQNDDYILKAKGRIRGGGPVLAAIAYYTVKAVAYGVPAAAAAGGVATVAGPALLAGGVAGGIAGGGSALAGTAIAAAEAALVGGGAVATAGSAVVGGAVVGAVGLEAATVASAATISSVGLAGYIAGVEVAATAAGSIFLAVPFL